MRKLEPLDYLMLGLGGLALGGVAYTAALYFTTPDGVPLLMATNEKQKRVLMRERAAGVHPRLMAFLDWWEVNGPFQILVAPDGGVRSAITQQSLFEKGRALVNGVWHVVNPSAVVTQAPPAQAPHVRKAALDLWPVGFKSNRDWAGQPPGILEKFRELGRISKEHGFVWGGDWYKKDAAGNNLPGQVIGWDAAHREIPGWQNLPMDAVYPTV